MSLERNKELAGAAIAIRSPGDFSRVLEIFTPDYVMHQHHDAAVGGAGDLGLVRFLEPSLVVAPT